MKEGKRGENRVKEEKNRVKEGKRGETRVKEEKNRVKEGKRGGKRGKKGKFDSDLGLNPDLPGFSPFRI